MLRTQIQAIVGKTLGPLLRMSRRRRTVILCYHSVHPNKDFSVTPAKFDQQLAWLRQHCDVVSFRDALSLPAGTRPKVAITFDDGYADNFEYAFPLLQKHSLPATFFLTAGLMDLDPEIVQAFQLIRNSDFAAIQPMTWQQVREMRSAGQEFGAHTYSHANLAELSFDACLRELTTSKEILERELGAQVDTLAYPFGLPGRNFTGETMRAAQQAGYQMACAVHYRPVLPGDSAFALPRFSILDENIDIFADKIRGNWDYLGWWQQNAPVWLRRRAGSRQPVSPVLSEKKIVGDRVC